MKLKVWFFFCLCLSAGFSQQQTRSQKVDNVEEQLEQLELFQAASEGKTAAVRNYLLKGKSPNIHQLGQSLLFVSASSKQPEVVKLLLREGADVNIVNGNDYGWNALHGAAVGGDLETLKILLADKQINKNAKTKYSETAAVLAALFVQPKALELLIASGVDFKPSLVTSAGLGSEREVRGFLEAGENPNQAAYQDTPMSAAASQGHTNIIGLLLSKGADKNALNARGGTALHDAVGWNRGPAIAQLLKAGVDVNIVDKEGNTAMSLAIASGQTNTVPKLLKAGAKDRSITGAKSHLQLALLQTDTDVFVKSSIIKSLIDHGADVNGGDPNTPKPLSLALADGHLMPVQILLKAGVNLKNGRYLIDAVVRDRSEPTGKPVLIKALLVQCNIDIGHTADRIGRGH